MASVFAALKAVLEIISAARDIVKFVEESKKEAWWAASNEAFGRMREAKTPEQRKEMAKAISELIAKI